MKTVFYSDRISGQAFVNPEDTVQKVEHFPQVCVSTFSREIVDRFAAMEHAEVIAQLYNANGTTPVYKIVYRGKEIAFYLSPVGAPACVCALEEIIAMGGRKFVFFGCCGVLDDRAVRGRLIAPAAAVRDEGTSYHYVLPGDEIAPDPDASAVLTGCLKRCGYPFVTGKIWTTDAVYRETKELIRERRDAGCIGVDMEYSALLAAAEFRKVPLVQFFFGADSLDSEIWQQRDLTDYGLSRAQTYMELALECALEL